MATSTPERFTDIEACVDWIIEKSGSEIRLALPLGLGKANLLANAIYQRALDDSNLHLVITTALSLEIPTARSDLERRFLDPFVERIFGDYPSLRYALDRRAGKLPNNIDVVEFFMAPGALLSNAHAQQNYVSSNYTHITRDLIDRGVNVIGQLVTHQQLNGKNRFSLSCNPDLTLDIAARQRAHDKQILVVGEVNQNLPFMYGDAVVDPEFFDAIIESPETTYRLFGTPKTSISDTDYMIGLNASTLVRDGGTLQLGIGSLGDAVVYGLKLRHENNSLYRQVIERCELLSKFGKSVEKVGALGIFDAGLYGATEMLVDGFLELYKMGILKRRVYENEYIQRLLNENKISEAVTSATLTEMVKVGGINKTLSNSDVSTLKKWGILKETCVFEDGRFVFSDGAQMTADVTDPDVLHRLASGGLGECLENGVIAHGGFFLGPQEFYDGLNQLSEEERQLINMTSVLSVNQLYGNEVLDSLQRKDARFINSCLIVTLMGAVVSDGLDDQRVLSGVGGQFNFVTMAHALPDGRSILKVRSTRTHKGQTKSNIRLSYGHTTIPRHLRDFVVSEYGIADLRGHTDYEVVTAMLNIADSRFQPALLADAKRAGKVPKNYQIPEQFQDNVPEKINDWLSDARTIGAFPEYPFGTDLTETEQVLAKALKRLGAKTQTLTGKLRAIASSRNTNMFEVDTYLERMQLKSPRGLRQRLSARLLAHELNIQLKDD